MVTETLKRWGVVLVVGLLCGACTNASAAERALEAQGFTDVQVTGYAPFNCAEEDFSSTGFTATNANGQRVDGVVCCGLVFKNCTVRW